jgi:resolvase, N-terminal domain protein
MQVEGYSIDAQKELLVNFAKSKEYSSYKFYIDGGYSGKDLNRPAIQELMKDVENHEIDTVIVFKLDRISRSQRDTLYLIEEVFNKYNVGFISVRENFDTTSPFGKAMIGILSVFAQLERETILERTRLGLRKRAEAGLWRGGGKIPFPYDYDEKQGILIPNPEKVELLNKMITLYLGGSSFLQISNIVDMDESMVEKRILSRTNLGIIPYKGEEFEGQHEPVVSEEIYNRIIKMNKLRSKSRTARHYLLSGKIYCGKCGAKYRYQKWGKRLICYCYSQQKSRPKFIKDPNCKNKRYDSFEIEDAVLENIFAMSLDEKMFEENMLTLNVNTVEELENRINKLSNQIENLLNYISLGIAIKETSNKINVLEEERKKLKEQLKDEKETQSQIETTKSMIKNLREVWNYMAFNEKRLIIEHLVEKIVIDDNKISIYYQLK